MSVPALLVAFVQDADWLDLMLMTRRGLEVAAGAHLAELVEAP